MKHFEDTIALSAGAACIEDESYVMKALNRDKRFSGNSVRIGFGRFSTEKEI